MSQWPPTRKAEPTRPPSDLRRPDGTPGTAAKWERWSLPITLGVVLLFLIPAVAGWQPMFHDANIVETVPKMIAVARHVQNGELPLWDSNVFSGAVPHYVNDDTSTFYLPMVPFLLAADVDDPAQCFTVLFLLPFCLHVLFATLGAYLFGQRVLRVRPAACGVLGLMYGLGPELGMATQQATAALVVGYLPWVMLAVGRFMATRRAAWWVAGAALIALMSTTGQASFLTRKYFYTFGAAVCLAVFCARADRKVLWGLLGTAGMFVVGIAAAAPVWAGTLEAAAWFRQTPEYERIMAGRVESLPPVALVTLFVPSFLGTLNSAHGWGVALSEGLNSWFFLTGGMVTVFAAVAGALAIRRRAGHDDARDAQCTWSRVALTMLLLIFAIVLGRHTPLFRPLAAVIPLLKLPHPIYYRTGQSWFLAVLAAVGVSRILSGGVAMPRRVGRFILAGCLAAALATGAVALYAHVPAEAVAAVMEAGGEVLPDPLPAWKSLTCLRDWDWFLRGPVLYFAAATALLATVVLLPRRFRLAAWLVPAGVVAEGLLFGFSWFYQARAAARDVAARGPTIPVMSERYTRVADHPYYQLAPKLKALTAKTVTTASGDRYPKGVRWVGEISHVDNIAWITDGHALLGFDSKPLMPSMYEMVTRFTKDVPYDLKFTTTPSAFLHNMNVGYVVLYNSRYTPEDLAASDVVAATDFLSVVRLPPPMDFAYTQDRVVELPLDRQADRLYGRDLRQHVCVRPGVAKELVGSKDAVTDRAAGDYRQAFRRLQADNPIDDVDRSRANRITVRARIARPAMLVIAECYHPGWSATVDGEPVTLHRVNYLQQGLWLTPGNHTVELRFFPRSVGYGLAAGGGAVASIVVVAAVSWRRRRTRAKAAAERSNE